MPRMRSRGIETIEEFEGMCRQTPGDHCVIELLGRTDFSRPQPEFDLGGTVHFLLVFAPLVALGLTLRSKQGSG